MIGIEGTTATVRGGAPAAGPTPCCCRRGRDPADLGRRLWAPRPGPPPAGLTLGAARRYLQGFRDGLTAPAERAAEDPGAVPTSPSTR